MACTNGKCDFSESGGPRFKSSSRQSSWCCALPGQEHVIECVLQLGPTLSFAMQILGMTIITIE